MSDPARELKNDTLHSEPGPNLEYWNKTKPARNGPGASDYSEARPGPGEVRPRPGSNPLLVLLNMTVRGDGRLDRLVQPGPPKAGVCRAKSG